jgi:hypothetical protein
MQTSMGVTSSPAYKEVEPVADEVKKVEEKTEPPQEQWKEGYDKLLALQEKRAVHPLNEDNPKIFHERVDLFLEVFLQAPEEKKQFLATSPLFPEHVKFIQFEKDIKTTKPLNYVMFTARKDALDAIAPYLKDEDWKALGPYGSTFMHCVVAGLEKKVSRRGQPTIVVNYLLNRFPELRTKRNEWETTPLDYIRKVLPSLESDLSMIKTHGGGGWCGLNPCYTFKDVCDGRYNLTASDLEILIFETEEITKLLA